MSPTKRLTNAGRDARGFTIMELMVVCAILGVLAMLAFPRMQTFMNAQETKQSATEMAGVLEMARSRAVAEATPQLVYVNDPTVDANGDCGPVAVIVRDLDHNYALSDGDVQQSISLSPEACQKVKQYGEGDTATPYQSVTLPVEDLAARAGELIGAVLTSSEDSGSDSGESESEDSGSGSSGSGSTGSGTTSTSSGKTARAATVSESVVNGSTFPIDQESGRPVIAFSERGIPVDPRTPTRWGSGAGAIYLTDGKDALYAAIVNPLGSIKLKKYEAASNTWR
jgi:prepilin-type N-terminal cleavage/methylation domain-containing protein